ncbi:unnamed protein product [Agarophyton chilense]
MSQQGLTELETLLIEFSDTIKLKLDDKLPADIEPLRVNLKQDAVPVLETGYAKAGGSRKKKTIAKDSFLDLGWVVKHTTAFKDLQKQLKEATRLAQPDPEKVLCLHTDASDKHWATCATQCDQSERSKSVEEEVHQPLAFLSRSFSQLEENWSTSERKAFAVVQAFRKLG